MFARNRLRQIVFVSLVSGLMGLIGLVAVPHRVDSAVWGEITAEITPELTRQPELSAQPELTAQPKVLRREILVGRAWMVARGAGEVDAESPTDLDASLGVYTTSRAWHLFTSGVDERPPKPGSIGAEHYFRPLFIMPITGNNFKPLFGGPPRPPNVIPDCYTTYIVVLFADNGSYHGSRLIPEGGSVPDLTKLLELNTSATTDNALPRPTQSTPEITTQHELLTREVLFDYALEIAQSAGKVDAQWGEEITASLGVYTTVNAWNRFNGEALVPASAACTTEADEARRPLFVMPFAGRDFEPVSEATLAAVQPIQYTAYIVALFADDGSFYDEKLIAEGAPLANLERLRAMNASFFYDDGYGE